MKGGSIAADDPGYSGDIGEAPDYRFIPGGRSAGAAWVVGTDIWIHGGMGLTVAAWTGVPGTIAEMWKLG
jgi:hypothetical protein